MKEAILVFLGMGIMDFIWGCNVVAMARHHNIMAGVYATIFCVVSGYVTISFVNKPMLLIPAAFGAFIGTFIASKWMKGKYEKES